MVCSDVRTTLAALLLLGAGCSSGPVLHVDLTRIPLTTDTLTAEFFLDGVASSRGQTWQVHDLGGAAPSVVWVVGTPGVFKHL